MRVFRGIPPEEAAAPTGTGPVAADVALTVVNGTGRLGEALAGRRGFEAAGFHVIATAARPPYDTAVTSIEHGPGQVAEAALVARHLPPGTTVVEVPVDPASHREAHAELRRLAHEALTISG